METDLGEASRVVKQIEEWFARVPFETMRQEFLEAPDFETATRRMTELGYEIPDIIDPAVEIPVEGIAGLRDEAGFVGRDGWVRFWGAWEQIGDHVVIDGLNRAQGRESGAPVEWLNTQVWTVRQGKVIRLVGYGTREEALATLHAE